MARGNALDVSTIIKSSQTISGEIELKSLLQKMMQIIMMNAAAENGFLLLEKNEQLFIQSIANGENIEVLQNISFEKFEDLPKSIINSVQNLKEPILLDNASDSKYTNDEIVRHREIKSVLC